MLPFPSNSTKNIIISIVKSSILKRNTLKRIELRDGISKVTLILALTTKTPQMKHKPLFFRLQLALVGDFHRVGLHKVKFLTRMLHYENYSWIKFHCLQPLSPFSLNFTALIVHLLQPPKISSLCIPESKIRHKTKRLVQFFKTCNKDKSVRICPLPRWDDDALKKPLKTLHSLQTYVHVH